MGNICCNEEQQKKKKNTYITPKNNQQHNSQSPSSTLKAQQQEILQDFMPAIDHLHDFPSNNCQKRFKGMFIHNQIAEDLVSRYYICTLVDSEDNYEQLVLKRIRKSLLIELQSKRLIAIEHLITNYQKSNFIVKSILHHESEQFLDIFFDLRRFYHLNSLIKEPFFKQQNGVQSEYRIKFMAAGIVLVLEYLHDLRIVYLGINFQNIVFGQDGYPILTNLSALASEGTIRGRIINPFASFEEINQQSLTTATDLWKLGVLIYYLITNSFLDFNFFQENTFKNSHISAQLEDLVNRLLFRRPQMRLGAFNINQLKSHAFFKDMDWRKYEQRQLPSPFRQSYISKDRNYQQMQQINNSSNEMFFTNFLLMDMATMFMIYQMTSLPQNNDQPLVEQLQEQPRLQGEEGVMLQLQDNDFFDD